MGELDSGIHVGITQDDVRALAPQLQGHPLHVVGRGFLVSRL